MPILLNTLVHFMLVWLFATAQRDQGNMLEGYKGSYLNPALVLIVNR